MSSGETEKYQLPDVVPPFVSVLRIESTAGFPDRNRPHFHPDTVEVCFVAKGRLDWFVGEESYVVHPTETLLIPANVVHGAVDSNLQPCDIYALHFAPEQLPAKLSAGLIDLPPSRLRHKEVRDLIVSVLEMHRNRTRYVEEKVAALGALIAATVIEFEPDASEREESQLIRLAQKALMGKEGIRPTVDQVALRLGVSAVWLHKLFVRETGSSPGDWARAKRIVEAKRRLAEGTESNMEIAESLGYSSGQTFATAFRKESGMTPSQYRDLHAGGTVTTTRTVYRADMRETWVDGVQIYPPPSSSPAISISEIETKPSLQ